MLAPYIRIGLRYIAGYLVIKGLMPQDMAETLANDPEVVAMIGIVIAAAVEGAYALAKRWGWTT
jgi:hypothetical protein